MFDNPSVKETIQESILGTKRDGTERKNNNLEKMMKKWLFHKHRMARNLQNKEYVSQFFFDMCAENAMEIDRKFEQLKKTIHHILTAGIKRFEAFKASKNLP